MAGRITYNNPYNITKTSMDISVSVSGFSYGDANSYSKNGPIFFDGYGTATIWSLGGSITIDGLKGYNKVSESDEGITYSYWVVQPRWYGQDYIRKSYYAIEYSWNDTSLTDTQETTIVLSYKLNAGAKNDVSLKVTAYGLYAKYSGTAWTTADNYTLYYRTRKSDDSGWVGSGWVVNTDHDPAPTSIGYGSITSWTHESSDNYTYLEEATASVTVYSQGDSFSFGATADTSKIHEVLTKSAIDEWQTACKAYRQWKAQEDFTMPVGCDASSGGTVTAAWYNACVKAKTGSAGSASSGSTRITAALINALDISYS